MNRVHTVDCAKLLEGFLLWTLGFFSINIVDNSCHLNFDNFY